MSSQRYTPEFKDEAVRQIIDCGYTVSEVSERLGVSSHSLYKWVKAVRPDKSEKHTSEGVEWEMIPSNVSATVLEVPMITTTCTLLVLLLCQRLGVQARR